MNVRADFLSSVKKSGIFHFKKWCEKHKKELKKRVGWRDKKDEIIY